MKRHLSHLIPLFLLIVLPLTVIAASHEQVVKQHAQASGNQTLNMEVTFYGWPDNDPPSANIALPVIHQSAGGTGTYDDPVTFATDPNEYPSGTKVYLPFLKKYGIMEDTCAQCITDWSGSKKSHIDIWMTSDANSGDAVIQCEEQWTKDTIAVEVNPPSGLDVYAGNIFDPQTKTCIQSIPAASSTTPQPSSITPTLYCLGGVPCPGTASIAPSGTAISQTPSQSPSIAQTSTAPVTSIDPCETGTASTFSNHSKHHRKWNKGSGGGFFEMLIEFLLKLIQLLFGGAGIPVPGNPSPSTTPSTTPSPSVSGAPSGAPCPSATVAASVAPSTGTPSTAPSTAIQPTVQATVQPTVATGGQIPAQIFSLANWKLTLPTGPAESPTEITQPQLATYTNDPWFLTTGSGIRFRAPVNGVTTSGSGYPRSELREMTSNGTANASWTTSSGTHTMVLDEAITAVPTTKKHIVAGQIHDASDDIIVIRLEYPKLFVDIGGSDGPTLDANYTLGKRFTVKFEVTGGKTNIYYNNSTTPAYTMTKSYSGAYFKAGAYTQSNCTTEASNLCTASNYGEVIIYKATVTHQ